MTEHRKLDLITTAFKVLIVLVVAAALVFGYMQIRGLRSRMTTAENRLNDRGIQVQNEDKESGAPLKYTIINEKDGEAEVESYDPSKIAPTATGVTYEKKKVRIFEVEITNVADYPVDIDPFSIRAKTDKGQLISPTNTKEQSQNQMYTLTGLAPGGTKKMSLYFVPIESETIIGLFDNINNQEL